METVELIPQPNNEKFGKVPAALEPNVTEDSLFTLDGQPLGFYIRKPNPAIAKLLRYINYEFKSDRVPKSTMSRDTEKKSKARGVEWIQQYSTILGAIPPKQHFKRDYSSISSVHNKQSAQPFIKAMYLLCQQSEAIVEELLPKTYQVQREAIAQLPEQYRFGRLFTSSICNFNAAAPYHQDRANIHHTINVIYTRRNKSTGGNLVVPDYGLVFDQCDYSMIVYPAWANMHGVTPIVTKGGYRNSFIFYPVGNLS